MFDTKRAADAPTHWLVVTIQIPLAELASALQQQADLPVRALGDTIEIDARSAPQARGTELRARPRVGRYHTRELEDVRMSVRAALRETKQLVEVGYVTHNRPQPEGTRPRTPTGLIEDAVVRRAQGKGVL